MRTTFLGLVTLTALGLTSSVPGAQAPGVEPIFGQLVGTWELDTSGNASLPSERRVITIAPEWLRVEILRAADDRPPVLTYRFDGRDVVNPFGSGKATSRLLREQGAVITETIYEVRGTPITIRETLSSSADGTEMTVNTMLRVEHGYEGPRASGETKPPNVSHAMTVFRKRPE